MDTEVKKQKKISDFIYLLFNIPITICILHSIVEQCVNKQCRYHSNIID